MGKIKDPKMEKKEEYNPEEEVVAVGVFKFLKNTTDGKVRAILRQETTNKIMANFYVHHYERGLCEISEHKLTKNSWTWKCLDFSDIDVAQRITDFAARYKTIEDLNKFKEVFEDALKTNDDATWGYKK